MVCHEYNNVIFIIHCMWLCIDAHDLLVVDVGMYLYRIHD
jgi:hypothetical protein